eukprot:UN27687
MSGVLGRDLPVFGSSFVKQYRPHVNVFQYSNYMQSNQVSSRSHHKQSNRSSQIELKLRQMVIF